MIKLYSGVIIALVFYAYGLLWCNSKHQPSQNKAGIPTDRADIFGTEDLDTVVLNLRIFESILPFLHHIFTRDVEDEPCGMDNEF